MVDEETSVDKCLDSICTRVARFFACEQKKSHAKSVRGLIKILRECGLTVRLSIPWYFMLWPGWWLFARSLIRKGEIREEVSSGTRKVALIHCLDAVDIYGISELWTHVVADLFDTSGANLYIDSYGSQVLRDFPGIDFRHTTLDERLAMLGPKIIVTERPAP